jgi:hypothetical protein
MKIKRFHAITYVARCHAPVSHRHAPVSHREATRKYEPEAPARHSTQRGTRANALPCWRYRVGICRINFSTPTPSANSYGFADAVEKNAMIARLQ